MQGLTYAEAEKFIIDVLQIRKSVNKKGGRKFIPLSKQTKVALENKRLVCIPIHDGYQHFYTCFSNHLAFFLGNMSQYLHSTDTD